MPLNTIYELVQEDLDKVEERLKSVSKVDFTYLSELLDYSLQSVGKRIRPILTLLSGKFYDCNLEHLVTMATSVEVMHTATLVHDDAIDKSSMRRGRPTICTVWGEDRAVLLGDYLFAKATEFATDTHNLQVIRLTSQTLMTISSGELNQAFNAFNLNQTREDYFRRVSRKTASLFSLSTESGAILSQAPEESIEILKDYGHNLGIAFQIVDDILDFIGTEEELGKPVGSDLAQGTLTLPAMLVLERYPDDNPVKRLFQENGDRQKHIPLAIELIGNSPIVQECYNVAADYCAKACRNLGRLPDVPSRQSLIQLADYIVRRKK